MVSDRFAKAFDRSGTILVVARNISKSFDRVWLAGFLHKLKSYWIWVFMNGKFFQECPVNSVCAKAPFLVLHFSYYTIMPNLLMLSVIFLSMLMILSTLNVIGHLIYGNNYSWPLNLNLIYETLWTGSGSALLISLLEKLMLFHLVGVISLIVLMDRSVFEEI